MILQTLTPEQTNIWIKNLDQLVKLFNTVQEFYRQGDNLRKQQFDENYNNFIGKYWLGADSFDELWLRYDGHYYTFNGFWSCKLKKIKQYSDDEYELRWEVLRYIESGRKEKIRRLVLKWNKYASKPFQIDSTDFEMYQDIQKWHSELKSIAKRNGIYDEAFNLDENCL